MIGLSLRFRGAAHGFCARWGWSGRLTVAGRAAREMVHHGPTEARQRFPAIVVRTTGRARAGDTRHRLGTIVVDARRPDEAGDTRTRLAAVVVGTAKGDDGTTGGLQISAQRARTQVGGDRMLREAQKRQRCQVPDESAHCVDSRILEGRITIKVSRPREAAAVPERGPVRAAERLGPVVRPRPASSQRHRPSGSASRRPRPGRA